MDVACPVCLGRDFAREDKDTIDHLSRLDDCITHAQTDTTIQERPGREAYVRAMAQHKLNIFESRYTKINFRRVEMGLSMMDVSGLVESQKAYLDILCMM